VKRSEATFYMLVSSVVKIWCWFLALKNPVTFANVLSVFVVQLVPLSPKKRSVTVQNAIECTYSLALIFLNQRLEKIF